LRRCRSRTQLLGGGRQLGLQRCDLDPKPIGVGVSPLRLGPLALIDELDQLQLDAYGVILDPRIRHGLLIPATPGADNFPFAMPDPPVALVHGFGSSFDHTWREPGWVDLLADAGRDVVAIDLLGHGSSAKPHDPAAYLALESDLAARLPPVVDAVGFSLGARTLLGVAIEQPDRFRRLVVAGVGESLFRDDASDAIARAVASGTADEDDIAGRLFADYAGGPGNDRAALAACMRRPAGPMAPDALKAVTCPVLVVLGDKDFAGPAEPLVDALPDARLVTLKGCDHFATPKDFRFISAALDFIDLA
jgi:pimeloyl-ACP methyl ester carboxylesterase